MNIHEGKGKHTLTSRTQMKYEVLQDVAFSLGLHFHSKYICTSIHRPLTLCYSCKNANLFT